MAKHLSEDEITLTINAKAEKAQQNIRTFSKEIDRLGDRNKSLQRQMDMLEVAGKKDTDAWRQKRAEYGKNAAQIRELKKQVADQTKALDVNALTMAQLRKQARELQRQLDNTSRTINPEEWNQLKDRLAQVKGRMNELTETAKGFKEEMLDQNTMSFFRGELMVRFAEWVGRAAAQIKDFVHEGLEMAESADGITHAFRKLDNPDLLNGLRRATKGTVSDIELMKAAVKAKDFHIPLEDLGKYLSFAQLKAQQTGQSLDYMVDSIVTGLGRKSPMILDNLGLSAAEINEKTKETGDFMKGVAQIVEKELAAAGKTYMSAADRAAQKTTNLANKQRELGEALLPIKEEVDTTFGTMKIGIMQCVVWLATHRKATLALVLAFTALTISMTVLNAAFRTWIAQTTLAKVLTTAWAATANTLKGIYLLVAAAINTMRGNTVLATAQMRLFNTTCKSNVILLLVTALVAAGVAFFAYVKQTDRARQAMVNFNLEHAKVAADIKRQSVEIEKKVNETTAKEIVKIKTLQRTIHDTSKSYNQRKKAIADMQSIVPHYHASISKEGRLFKENVRAINDYIKNLRRAARAEAAYEKMKANEARILDAQDTIRDASAKQQRVAGVASKRGVNFAAGERVERVTQTAGAGFSGEVQTITVNVVVDKNGKFIRRLDDAAAKMVEKDRQWNEMFLNRKKAAQDSINQYQAQQKSLLKTIEENGGINQRFEPTKLNNNSKSGKKDPDDVATKLFAHDRSRDLEEEKQAYTESLNALKSSLIKKQITQEQYDVKATAINVKHQEALLEIEKSYSERAKNTTIKNADKKKQLLETQEKAVIDQKQAVYEAYLDMEKQYYANLDKLKATAPTQPQTLQEEREAKLLILEGYYQASLQMAEDDADRQLQTIQAYEAAKAAIVADYAKKAEEEKARARQEYGLDTFTDQLAARRKKIDEELAKGLLTQEQHAQAVANLEKDAEAHRLQILQQYGLDTFTDQLAARRKKIDEELAKGLLTQEQHAQAVANLEKDAEAHRLQIRQQYGLATQQELYDAELDLLKQHLEKKEISEAEYEEAVKNLKINKMKEAFDYYANLSGGAVQALQKAEEANVDAKYDAEIEAARNAGKDTTELEKKKANEKLKIQKKYADVDFAIKASQIIADTSVAIMRAYKDLPLPAAIAASALIGITGAAQLAAANAERQKIKKLTLNGASAGATGGARVATGLEKGGSIDVEREQDGRRFHAAYDPDRRGFVDKPTVIVGEGGYGHSKEWVASNAAVENPTVAPIIDIIDRAQRAGTIRTLDMSKFLLQQAQGRAAGGPIAPASPDPRPMPQNSEKDAILLRLINVLDRLESEGIQAAVALDEIDRKQQLRNRARQFGSKQ